MLNEEKIRIMTAMAVYEEKFGKKDRVADSYYMGDYIFKKNSWTRILVFIGYLLIAGTYLGYNILNENIDFFSDDFKGILIRFAVGLVLLLVVYTAIGTAIYKRNYNKAQTRLEKLEYLQKLFTQEELEEIIERLTDCPDYSVAETSRKWLEGEANREALQGALGRYYSSRTDWDYQERIMYKKALRLLKIKDLYDI